PSGERTAGPRHLAIGPSADRTAPLLAPLPPRAVALYGTRPHPALVQRHPAKALLPPQAERRAHPICIKLSCLTHNHGFRPRARPPYNTRILQSTGDSFGAFFFVCRATWGGLARGR